MKTSTKIGLLSSLYLSQGLPFGFFTQALPALLRQQDMSLPDIGLTYLLALPWALKFVWSPLMDRYGSERLGRRRGYILPLQLLSAAVLLLLALSSQTPSTQVLLAVVLLVNLLAATQDIATDGLAVNLLEERELGLGNGVQVAAYRVGMILGGGLLLVVFDAAGWRPTLLSLGAMLLVATVPIALYREPPSAPPAPGSLQLKWWLEQPGAGGWLLLLVIYKAGEAFATAMVRTLLVDAGFGLTELGWMLGDVGFTAGLVGALVGGALVNRLGRRRALILFGLFQSGAIALYALAARGASVPTLTLICGIEFLASGMATAALFTVMMEKCRPEHAGTDYTVQASVVVIATGAAAAASGFSAEALGYSRHFLLAAALSAMGALYVLLTFHPSRAPKSRNVPEVSS